jgi:hypothetical protein
MSLGSVLVVVRREKRGVVGAARATARNATVLATNFMVALPWISVRSLGRGRQAEIRECDVRLRNF